MTERRTVRHRRVIRAVKVVTLASYDPALAALDHALLAAGWKRKADGKVRRRRDGRVSGRVVWRRDGESIVWSACFAYEGCDA